MSSTAPSTDIEHQAGSQDDLKSFLDELQKELNLGNEICRPSNFQDPEVKRLVSAVQSSSLVDIFLLCHEVPEDGECLTESKK